MQWAAGSNRLWLARDALSPRPPEPELAERCRVGMPMRRGWPILIAVLVTACASDPATTETARAAASSIAGTSTSTAAASATTLAARSPYRRLKPPPVYDRTDAILVAGRDQLFLWTGGEVFGADPATGSWRRYAPLPERMRQPIVAWSGSELVVWRGRGFRLDPNADRWTPMAPAPITSRARDGTTARMVGAELIVWGGLLDDGSLGSDGAAYNPTDDTWRSLPPAPLSARAYAAGVVAADQLVVWGGTTTPHGDGGGLGSGAIYSLRANAWTAMPASPLSAGLTNGVWTGTEVLFAPTPRATATGCSRRRHSPRTTRRATAGAGSISNSRIPASRQAGTGRRSWCSLKAAASRSILPPAVTATYPETSTFRLVTSRPSAASSTSSMTASCSNTRRDRTRRAVRRVQRARSTSPSIAAVVARCICSPAGLRCSSHPPSTYST